MNTTVHLAFAFALLCLAAGVGAAHRLWHDRTSQFDEAWPTWPLGEERWHGFVRAFPTFAVGNFVSLSFAWPLVVLENGPDHDAAVGVLTLATATAFLLTIGLTVLIMATRRPTWLVPPHLRDRDDR